MHSRIYEIREKGSKLRCEIPDWWENSEHCDYLNEESNDETKGSIEWLAEVLKCEVKDNCITLTEEQITSYLTRRYEFFKKHLEELNNTTLQDFMGKGENVYKVGYALYNLKTDFSDEGGFWFLIGGDMYTLEEFMRYFGPGEYEIMNTWDYHF